MDVLVAAILGLINALNGCAWLISPEKWSERGRRRFKVMFALFSFAGVALVVWQAVLAHESGEETRKLQLGDAGHPPYIAIISLPNRTFFVRTNASDYPAYSVQIHLYSENDQTHSMRSYGPEEMAAHTAIMGNDPWTTNDNLEHRFTAEVVTRTGISREELVLRPAGNNQWMMACRIDGLISKCQQPDSAWPRDANAQPDWN
jgi:hypothetical protein